MHRSEHAEGQCQLNEEGHHACVQFRRFRRQDRVHELSFTNDSDADDSGHRGVDRDGQQGPAYLLLMICVEGQSVYDRFVQGIVPEVRNSNGIRNMVVHARQEIHPLLLAFRLRASSSSHNHTKKDTHAKVVYLPTSPLVL